STSNLFSEVGNQQVERHTAAQQIAADFQDRLNAAGIPLGDRDSARKLVAEARDYFWVEFRLAASGPWETVHPAFGKDVPPNVQQTATIQDSIPPELQQRIRFDVEIEQQLNGRLTRKKVMAGWERPTANLIGMQISYVNVPSSVEHAADFADPAEVARKSKYFIPVFNGSVPPGAQFFDLDGVTIPPEAASSPASGVFKQVGEKTEAAASALAGLGAKPAPGQKQADIRSLTGAWLIYTLIVPGEAEKTIRRTFFDPIGTDGRRGGQMVGSAGELDPVQATLALAQSVTFMVSPCDYPDAYILDRSLEQFLQARLLWQSLLELQYGKSAAEPSQEAWNSAQRTPEFTLFPIIQAFLRNRPNLVSYIANPSIIGSWSGISSEGDKLSQHFAADIVFQGRRTLQTSPDGPIPAVDEAMLSGIWATENERFVVLASGLNGVTPVGAIDTLHSAKQSGVRMVAISPKNPAAANALDVPPTMKLSINAALAQGYAVVAPERVAAGVFPGWWRVDPATGSTLGMGPQGRGGDVAEYVLKAINMAMWVSAAFAKTGYEICVHNGCGRGACMKEALKGWVQGIIITLLIELIPLVVGEAASAANLWWSTELGSFLTKAYKAAHFAGEYGHHTLHVYEVFEKIHSGTSGECESESESE
ncbi:MAG: hypothetical protein WAM60_03235, partial [Candidatus Promineifilaceae bacterium]